MLADMAMELEAARQLVYVAAAKSERGDKDLTFFGAAAKCYASDVAMKITTDAVQLLGGAGYTSDFPLERMMRDAKITQIYEGTNQVQRIVMARQLLSLRRPPARDRRGLAAISQRAASGRRHGRRYGAVAVRCRGSRSMPSLTPDDEGHLRVDPTPPVSVIMPLLNEERHLADAVGRSSPSTTRASSQIVLAVGPGHDDTLGVARRLAERATRGSPSWRTRPDAPRRRSTSPSPQRGTTSSSGSTVTASSARATSSTPCASSRRPAPPTSAASCSPRASPTSRRPSRWR